jgi:hypothetical protein
MGLSISVGVLNDLEVNDPEGAAWFQESLEALNTVLLENGLEPHLEPLVSEPISTRAASSSFSYSRLHYLRRVYAHAAVNPNWRATRLPDGTDPTKDPVLDDAYSECTSHLICHSDAEGFYVPQDFKAIISVDSATVPGGLIGSSQRLLHELLIAAPALGIKAINGQVTDLEAKRINAVTGSRTGLNTEFMVWFALYEAARASIHHNTLIVFN